MYFNDTMGFSTFLLHHTYYMSHEPQHRAAEGRDEPSLFL